MIKNVQIKMNLKGIKDLKKTLNNNIIVKIGILGSGQRNDGGLTNAQVGVKHEFGSPEDRIPPRSFLRMPLQLKNKDLMKVLDNKKITKLVAEDNLEGALSLLGIKAEAIIQEAFASRGFGTWKANSQQTIKMKGSSAPLVDTSQLRKSITSKVVKK